MKYFNTLLKKDVTIKILFDNINLSLLEQLFEINKTSSNKIQIGYTNKLGNFNELIMINDQKFVMRIKNDDILNLSALVSNEEHNILLQSILFEKYWNEVKSLEVIKGN